MDRGGSLDAHAFAGPLAACTDRGQFQRFLADRVGADIEFGDVFAQRFAGHGGPIQIEQARTTAIDAAQNGVYSSGIVAVFHDDNCCWGRLCRCSACGG